MVRKPVQAQGQRPLDRPVLQVGELERLGAFDLRPRHGDAPLLHHEPGPYPVTVGPGSVRRGMEPSGPPPEPPLTQRLRDRQRPVPDDPRAFRHRRHDRDGPRPRRPRGSGGQLVHVGVARSAAGPGVHGHHVVDLAGHPCKRPFRRQHPGRAPGGHVPPLRRSEQRPVPGHRVGAGEDRLANPPRRHRLRRLRPRRRARGWRPHRSWWAGSSTWGSRPMAVRCSSGGAATPGSARSGAGAQGGSRRHRRPRRPDHPGRHLRPVGGDEAGRPAGVRPGPPGLRPAPQ